MSAGTLRLKIPTLLGQERLVLRCVRVGVRLLTCRELGGETDRLMDLRMQVPESST